MSAGSYTLMGYTDIGREMSGTKRCVRARGWREWGRACAPTRGAARRLRSRRPRTRFSQGWSSLCHPACSSGARACQTSILYFFLQICSHVSRTLITNFGRGHTSLGPLSNLQEVMQVPKLPKKCRGDEIFEVSRKNLAAAEMSNK
jgi:hypothetical protein